MNKKSGTIYFLFFACKSILKKTAPFLLCFLLGLPKISLAQKEANNWYFGENAGISFNYGSPVALTNGKLFTYEGCATISNSNGRLLFYTDGISVWDSTHKVTPNGTALKGNYSSTQSAIIVPRPDSVGSYYIFTCDELGDANGLCYSEFKMALNSGKGDIVSSKKNTQLIKSSCEKITAVKHANGRDYWVLAHHFGTDTMYSFLITPAGISSKVVKSNTRLKIPKSDVQSAMGYLKVSPNGSKIAYANHTLDSLALGDFNTANGVVSNVMIIYFKLGYGIEFSAGSKYLYATEFTRPNLVVQFNANPSSKSAFKASKVILDTNSSAFALQLGPDEKIYITEFASKYLNVIHAPDSAGKACRYAKDYVYLGGKISNYGLPTFIPSIFRKSELLFTRNCLNDSTFMWPYVTNNPDSVKIDFGDTASGLANYSRGIDKTYHIYKKPGVYQVKLISYYKNNIDTTRINIPINSQKPFIGNDTVIPCRAFSMTLKTQKNYIRYKWSNGDTLKSSTIKTHGTFILTATDSLKCVASDTLVVKNPLLSASFTIDNNEQCKNYNRFQFKNTTIFTNDSLKSLVWKLSDNTSYADSGFIKSFSTADSFHVKLIVNSLNGCKDSVSKLVVVHPNTEIGFSTNKFIQCFNGHDFIFRDTSTILRGSIQSYRWNLGDGDTANSKDISSKKYSLDSTYNITLITATDRGCKDTLRKIMTVYPNPKAVFSINRAIQCFNYNRFDYKNLSHIKAGKIVNNIWDLGDSKRDTSKNIVQKKYATSDSFNIQLLVISEYGCRDSLSNKVFVNPNTNSDFSINRNPQCFNGHNFIFTNASKLLNGTIRSYNWELGDGDIDTAKDILSKKYGKESTYQVRLIATTNHGCKDTISKNVMLHPNPLAGFLVNQSTQCFNRNSFDYTNSSAIVKGSISANDWSLGDGDHRNTKDVIAKHYNSMDSFKVNLQIVSDNGCRDSLSKWVKILDTNSEFDISVDSTSCPVYTFRNISKNYKSIKWDLVDTTLNKGEIYNNVEEFSYRFSQSGTFKTCLYIENINGCLDTLCKVITVNITKELNIPNVFTPGNNDKLNDAFDIETKGMEYYHLEIYNRWGLKIFETNKNGIGDDGNNWNGRPNAAADLYPDGVYFYILNYRYKCEDTTKEAHGILTLLGQKD